MALFIYWAIIQLVVSVNNHLFFIFRFLSSCDELFLGNLRLIIILMNI